MKILPREKIVVRDRQRTKIESGPLTELRESILSKGLMHPPVVWHDAEADKWVLIAGERRLRAIDLIFSAGLCFSCDGLTITAGDVPVTEVSELDPIALFEAEFDENVIREDLTWQDKTRALAALHAQRKSENPSQTKIDTAREISTRAGGTPGLSTESLRKGLQKAIIIADKLDDPAISKARNANEAHALILQKEEAMLRAELARRKLSTSGEKPEIRIICGSMFDVLPTFAEGQVDLILADPPYGIDAGGAGFRGRTVHHHNYQDDAETARKCAHTIFEEGFRLSKPRANLFLFCDIKAWFDLRAVASRLGWEVFPRPIIWQKSESEGLAPWGRQGFRVTYETILYATKGGRGLITSPVSILNVKRVPRHVRVHAAEKPVDLLKLLVDCSTIPGDLVLDPCCGSGSTLVACKELRRRAIGIELDQSYHDTAMSNVFSEEGVEECPPTESSSSSDGPTTESVGTSSEPMPMASEL